MAVYSYGHPRRFNDSVDICQGFYKKAAADIPPDPVSYETDEAAHETQKRLFDDIAEEFFGGNIDSDKLFFALIIYFLIKEGADIKLILALGYILL